MPMKTVCGAGLGVVAGDVLALRGTGLAAAETWALLCQAAQALQDLFLSNGGVVGGSRAGPVVTPHTLELTARGRVTLLQAPPDTARAYLPPEYRPGRVYSDTDSEKMWMYSLGRALLDTTPRATALTGTVSVSPSSALQSVLAAMTEPDPRRRASLMNLLDVISEYCRTRLQSRPFTHIVMDMYREVVRSAQYAARKRAMLQSTRSLPSIPPPQQQYHHPIRMKTAVPSRQNPPVSQEMPQRQQPRHRVKGALFRAQSRNSRSQPNLLSMLSSDVKCHGARTNADGGGYGHAMDARHFHQHVRTNSHPDCYMERGVGTTIPQVRSSSNLPAMAAAANDARNVNNPYYGDPIYSMPVKPFLSSQDIRNADPTARQFRREEVCSVIGQNNCGNIDVVVTQSSSKPGVLCLDNGVYEQTHIKEDLYATSTKSHSRPIGLQRQHSSPQFPSTRSDKEQKVWEFANPLPDLSRAHNGHTGNDARQQHQQQRQLQEPQQKQNSEGRIPYVPRGPPPPKPPRIITSLKKAAAAQAALDVKFRTGVKPQRDIQNGPRARRGRAVQRAPSRLYRAINGPARSFNKTQCVGPEFVVRANQPVKLLTVGDFKMNNIGRLTVILLNGQRVEVTCDPQKVTAGELFQAIVQTESLEENFMLGLAALLAGDFAMLPPDTKLNKVAPPGWLNSGKSKGLLGLPTSFMLYLRLRFFLPSLRGIRNWISKHMLYLQIRRCILEQQLVCSLTQLINLTGLALQAEFGNYIANEHGYSDYFLLEHYVPESLILNSEEQQYRHPHLPDSGEALRKRLQQAHRERRGLDANKAEEMFITHAQSLPDYGAHYYVATVDTKELGKIVAKQKKCADQNEQHQEDDDRQIYIDSENIYDIDKCSDYPIYGKIDFKNSEILEHNLQGSPFTDEQKIMLSKNPSCVAEEIYVSSRKSSEANNNSKTSSNNKSPSKTSKFKKNDSDVWLAIHSQGLKIFERGGRLRERHELAKFQWKEIQTLSYGKNYLVVYTRINGKRCKFKLRMDHRKSYYSFKLTSLHHQFFLKFRTELTSLQGLAKDFGVPLILEPNSPQPKIKPESAKTKISIAESVKKQQHQTKNPTPLEEQQNKENENPLKDSEDQKSINSKATESTNVLEENSALYAQVNARLEPEGESRDTEDEADCALIINRKMLSTQSANTLQVLEHTTSDRLYNYTNIGIPYNVDKEEYIYTIPKPFSTNDINRVNEKIQNPEDLYAAINKSGLPKKNEFVVPNNEAWKELEVQKAMNMVNTVSHPNFTTNEENGNQISPTMSRRLESKTGSRSIYSSLVRRNSSLTDDMDLLSLKSETASVHSASAKSAGSANPEAYVLNADIRTAEETFRIPDETMSNSLIARLDELSFAEERMLRTIKLERGHGGSIGLQVTEGNDGGVYVQAVSVGGSADMAGNVNKGDRIVAINGQSLLNLRYEDALKMLQSQSDTVELVLSQIVTLHDDHNVQEPIENNYLQNIRFNVSSEAETSGVMNTKWIQKTIDVASVQNTSSAYSSAASSAMGNHNGNSLYVPDIYDTNPITSANELPPPPPPIPPRRKKYKGEPKRLPSTYPCTTKPERKPRRPPIPPPAAPQRSRTGRKTPSPFPSGSYSPAITISHSSLEYGHNSQEEIDINILTNEPVLTFEDGTKKIVQDSQTNMSQIHMTHFDDGLKTSGSSTPFSKSPEPNKYPPLYFTFQDYQAVMEGSVLKSDKSIEEVTEKEEDLSTSASFMEKVSFKNEREEDISTSSSFMENVSFKNEREEIYFRITTTDRPFEKCLGNWKKSFENDVEFDDEPCSNFYVFEDYMDRSSAVNKFKAKQQLSFADDLFPVTQDDNSTLTERSTTRVRFVIESPSTSTPDLDLDDERVTYEEFVEKKFNNSENSTVELVEVNNEELQNLVGESNANESSCEVETEAKSIQELELYTVNNQSIVDVLLIDSEKTDSSSDYERNLDTSVSNISHDNEMQCNVLHIDNKKIDNLINSVGENISSIEKVESESYQQDIIICDKVEEVKETKTIFIDSRFYNLVDDGINKLHIYLEDDKDDTRSDENQDADMLNDRAEDLPILNELIDSAIQLDNSSLCTKELDYNSISNEVSIKNCTSDEATLIDHSLSKSSVPESVRRNSFLETMLSEDDLIQNSWNLGNTNCEIIATHLKIDGNIVSEQVETIQPVINLDTKLKPEKHVSPERTLIKSDLRSKTSNRFNPMLNNNKSTGEVKSDVLNELLTNFSSIKLRSINVHTCPSSDALAGLNEQRREESESVKVKTDEMHEIQQAEDTVNYNHGANSKLSTMIKGSNCTTSNDKDSCAIVEETLDTSRNNDNNATTSVVVSKDQFHEAASITPGSVRNFVKYYEIHSEISNLAKIKDNAYKKHKNELAKKANSRNTKKVLKTNEANKEISQKSAVKKVSNEKVVEKKFTNKISNFSSPSINPKSHSQNQSCIKSSVHTPNTERKKSVQFDNECKVINSHKTRKKKEEEDGTLSSFIGGIKTRLKRKAPVKPDFKKTEQQKGLKLDQQCTESSAVICIQKSPEAKASACRTKPGNRSFLPQTETLLNNQTFVFYFAV